MRQLLKQHDCVCHACVGLVEVSRSMSTTSGGAQLARGCVLGLPEGGGEENKEDRGVGALAVEVGLTVRLRCMAGPRPVARLRYLKSSRTG